MGSNTFPVNPEASVGADLHVREDLARLARMAARTLDAAAAGVCVGPPERPSLLVNVGSLSVGDALLVPFLCQADRQQAPLLVADVRKDERFAQGERHALRMAMVYPLFNGTGERLGFLWALSQTPRAFEAGDREALDDLAGFARLALREWRDPSFIDRAEQALFSFMQGLASDPNGDHHPLQARFLAEVLAMDGVLIAEFADPARQRMRTVARFCRGEILPEVEFAVAGTPIEPLLVNGAQTWKQEVWRLFPGVSALLEGAEACVATPLRNAAGEVYGVLMALRTSPLEEVTLVEALLPVVAAGIEARYKARRAEQELRIREATIRSVYEHATDLIFILDRNWRYINVNPAYARALGRPIEGIIGQPSGYDLPPHVLERVLETNARILETGQPTVYDTTMEFPEGIRSFSVVKFPYRDQTGEIVGVIGIARDISERKALERQKSDFIKALSHEIRTPLFAIQSAVRLLTVGCCDPAAEKGRRMLAIAAHNAERLVRLTHDVLSLEGLEAGLLPIEATACDAASLLEEAAASLAGLADEAGITLDVASPVIPFEACPERIMQVLVNLVGNAIKFSHAGSRIGMEAVADGEEVRFAVRDQGRGIPSEDLYRVFDPFHQVHPRPLARGGIGLGLPISREIVRTHGGRIWVESEVGVGSTFYVALPIKTRLRLSETLAR
ncbi:PAS domain-containing protein [bacterium]|nr:PAS domain-containing protein [bacterium]